MPVAYKSVVIRECRYRRRFTRYSLLTKKIIFREVKLCLAPFKYLRHTSVRAMRTLICVVLLIFENNENVVRHIFLLMIIKFVVVEAERSISSRHRAYSDIYHYLPAILRKGILLVLYPTRKHNLAARANSSIHREVVCNSLSCCFISTLAVYD